MCGHLLLVCRLGQLTFMMAPLLFALGAARPVPADTEAYRVTPVARPPVVDGKLDDECWKRACIIEGFRLLGNPSSPDVGAATRAWIAYDDDNLYVAYRCEEPLMERLVLEAKEHDAPTWKDDSVEIFLNPSGDRKRYVQIAINAAGVVMDGYVDTPGGRLELDYDTAARCATLRLDNEWTLETAIPLTRLPLGAPDAVWTFHLARNRACAQQHLTSLRSTINGFHEVGRFARLEGLRLSQYPVEVVLLIPGEMLQGANLCRVKLKNWSNQFVRTRIEAGMQVPGPTKGEPTRLSPRESAQMVISWELTTQQTGQYFCFRLFAGERLIHERSILVRGVPELFGEATTRAAYLDPNEFVRVDMPVNLADGSRQGARLHWRAFNEDGEIVGSGVTTVNAPLAVIRLFWLKWYPGWYTLDVELKRDGNLLASKKQRIRLVLSPWS